MKIRPIEIPTTQSACESLQSTLSWEIQGSPKFSLIGGVRIHYLDSERRIRAWAVTLSSTTWGVVEKQRTEMVVTLPRWEGCEGFREAPAILAALEKLHHPPDVLFVLGAGRTHIRRFGLACHVGLAADVPTVGIELNWPSGCFKPASAVQSKKRGSRIGLTQVTTNMAVGAELRTQNNQDPIYVSAGHRLSLEDAVSYTLRSCVHYRLPEPLRQASDAP